MAIYASVEGAKTGVLQLLREIQVPLPLDEIKEGVITYNEETLFQALAELLASGEIHINRAGEYVLGPSPRGRSRSSGGL